MIFKVAKIMYQNNDITKVKIKEIYYNGKTINYIHYKGNYTFERYKLYSGDIIDNDINGNEVGIENIKINNIDYNNEKDKLKNLFNNYGINTKECNNIISNIFKKYGESSYNMILDKPYMLFEFTDRFNIIEEMSKRNHELLCIFAILKSIYGNNHIFIKKDDFKVTKEGLSIDENTFNIINQMIKNNIQCYLTLLIKDGILIEEDNRIYIKKYYDIENSIDEIIRSKALYESKDKKQLEKIKEFFSIDDDNIKKFNKEQKQAIEQSLNEISIVTGGAGVGKTTTIYDGIIKLYKYLNPNVKIKVVGFTANSVNKINNKLISTNTIHKFLGITTNHQFLIDEREEDIDVDLLIIEEAGMIDIDLYYHLLKRLSLNTKIVMVGDYNQIESNGFGQVFKDLVNSNLIHKTELSKIYRQDNKSNIIKNSNKIVKCDTNLITNRTDFQIKNCVSGKIINKIEEEINKLMKLGYDYNNIMVLSPYRKNENGCEKLNEKISYIINKDRRYKFELGDKVVQTVNNYNKDVYNGEQGIVVGITMQIGNLIGVDISYGNKTINYYGKEINEIELAYSMTVHKMQGDECKVIIFVIDKYQENMLNRNLIYTAITRAKEKVIVIGDKDKFYEGIKKLPSQKNSGLLDRLCS